MFLQIQTKSKFFSRKFIKSIQTLNFDGIFLHHLSILSNFPIFCRTFQILSKFCPIFNFVQFLIFVHFFNFVQFLFFVHFFNFCPTFNFSLFFQVLSNFYFGRFFKFMSNFQVCPILSILSRAP